MGLRRLLLSDGFAFRGNPPHNGDPGIEATQQFLVSPPPSALSVKLPRTRLITKGSQHLLRMMWEDYPPQGHQCQASPTIPPKGQGRNCSRGVGQLPSLLGPAEQPRGASEVHCAVISILCFDGL